MKFSIIISMSVMTFFFATNSIGQIKNATTETVMIYGNCGMCEANIEKAGNVKKTAQVDWNKDTKMAMVTYNPEKTSMSEILKRIALAGYDSNEFLAPDEVYANLHGCCQYERVNKTAAIKEEPKMDMADHDHAKMMEDKKAVEDKPKMDVADHDYAKMMEDKKAVEDKPKMDMADNDHAKMAEEKKALETKPKAEMKSKEPTKKASTTTAKKQGTNQLSPVFDAYFAVKDALVQTNGETAAAKGKALLTAINAVKMESLKTEEHTAWMKVTKDLAADAKRIADTKDIAKQRAYFIDLSKNMYDLIKTAKTATPVYYQHCPMANGGKGANWLSKENAVKNPYYGSQMLSCGKTVETIKQ